MLDTIIDHARLIKNYPGFDVTDNYCLDQFYRYVLQCIVID